MDICFDCFSGVSGDMLVGALLSLGADENLLKNSLKSLKIGDFNVKISKFSKNNYFVTDFSVLLKEENHDHDLNFLYGKSSFQDIKLKRNFYAVKEILEDSKLTNSAKQRTLKIFEIIAKAESEAHGINFEDVIFHENGAMDSIIDIVSFAVCLESLKVKNVFAKNLCEGHGEINSRVGKLPIPTPAVKNILQMFNLEVKSLDVPYELITPTGIACLAAVANFTPKNYIAKNVGYGNGKRDYNLPCVLKVEEI